MLTGLTVGTVVVVNLPEAGGTRTCVRLVAWEAKVAAASVVASAAVPASCSDTQRPIKTVEHADGVLALQGRKPTCMSTFFKEVTSV